MARSRSSALRRALLEAELQYGSQLGETRSLLSSRAQEYDRTRRVNASTSRGIVAATEDAMPEVRDAYETAARTIAAQQQALGVTGGGEQTTAFARRNAEALAGALSDLTDRKTRAIEGREFANQQARSEYLSDKAKILGQAAELQDKSSKYAVTRYGEILDDQAKLNLDERRLSEQQRHNKVQEALGQERIDVSREKGREGAQGRKLASQEQHARARDEIEQAISYAQKMKKAGRGRAETIQLLTQGRAPMTLEDGDNKIKVPGIPKLSADFVRAAMNLTWDGTLSRKDVERLHNRRLSIKSLGYKTRKGKMKPRKPPRQQPTAPVFNPTQNPFLRG